MLPPARGLLSPAFSFLSRRVTLLSQYLNPTDAAMHSPSLTTHRAQARSTFSSLLAGRPGLYVLILLFSVLGAFAYKTRGEGVFACPGNGYGSDRYLAHCEIGGYADYDHGAFWFGLEPEARRHAVDADVVFLGSSRMQFAFSTTATDSWFAKIRVPYYLLGFTYTENVKFAAPLLSKLKPRARVYVINVDRFFDDTRETPPAKQILRESDAQTRYKDKQFWQSLHKSVCSSAPAICGSNPAFFRSRDTGAWELAGNLAAWNAATKTTSDGPVSDEERWDHFAALGREFVSTLPVEKRCVVLTIAPYDATKRAEAQAIADALGLDLVAPQPLNITTFDGSHLDRASAERWSQAFFDAAGPRIRECLDSSPRRS